MKTEHVSCNICGADETDLWGSKNGLNVVKCRKCGLVYTNPRPTNEELEKYYSNQYFEEGNYDGDSLRDSMYAIEIEKQVLRTAGSKGKFLDVGCARGSFLSKLPSTFEKYGLEYSKEAAEYARTHFGFNVQNCQLNQTTHKDGFFDIVHIRGVVEHLQDPKKDILTANRILAKGGWLIISTTPNIDSPVAKRYGSAFRLVMPQEHIYYFSPDTLTRLLGDCGFFVEKIFYPYLNTPYSRPLSDLAHFIFDDDSKTQSPPFWRSVMTVYAKKK